MYADPICFVASNLAVGDRYAAIIHENSTPTSGAAHETIGYSQIRNTDIRPIANKQQSAVLTAIDLNRDAIGVAVTID